MVGNFFVLLTVTILGGGPDLESFRLLQGAGFNHEQSRAYRWGYSSALVVLSSELQTEP